MLFQGNLHKGNFIKEIFVGSFTDYKTDKAKTQILCLSEKSLDLYEYSYDTQLKMSFLEPILSQDLFIHIYNGKIITDNRGNLEKEILIIITSCGLLALSFDSEERIFNPVASCILNLDCEEKDKLMYLKADSE
jgi:hypothetical protein